MACINPWPRMGLSTYIVCRPGASKPVSHMSRTYTIRSGSVAARNRFASLSRLGLLRICGFQSSGSVVEPVITTLFLVLNQHYLPAFDFPVKALWQARPVARFHQERNGGVT